MKPGLVSHLSLTAVILALVPAHVAAQTSLTAADESELRSAIFQASNDLADDGVAQGGPYTITITASITLTQSLPIIRTDVPAGGEPGITIDGAGFAIDADDRGRVFLIESGRVLIKNAYIDNARAVGGKGGDANNHNGGGGGGGLGAGAAVFVNDGAQVALQGVSVRYALSQGGIGGDGNAISGGGGSGGGGGGGLSGNGGFGVGAGGGGGGYAGTGGNALFDGGGGGGGEFGVGGVGTVGGGGGGGQRGTGGTGVSGGGGGAGANSDGENAAGSTGGDGGGAEGGPGGNAGSTGSPAANTFGGGGGGGDGRAGGSGLTSGGGGGSGLLSTGTGGTGGAGGGGGGAMDRTGGAGGRFGGGGGTGNDTAVTGGAGGFGGGGGGARADASQTGGAGGFGAGGGGGFAAGAAGIYGGAGGAGVGADGGGGAALGGAVFLAAGGTLTLTDSDFLGHFGVIPGQAGPGGTGLAAAGQALGAVAFLMAGTTLVYDVGAGATVNSPGGTYGAAAIAGDGGLSKTGPGVLLISNQNTYAGPTTVSAGTLGVNGTLSASAVTVQNGGSLMGRGTVGAVTVHAGGTIVGGDPIACCVLNTGNLTMTAGSTLNAALVYAIAGVNVNGTVDLGSAILQAEIFSRGPGPGARFTLVVNDGVDPVTGTFAGLPEGGTFLDVDRIGRVSYIGGTGNDVVLTVDPTSITDIPDQTTGEDTATGALAFALGTPDRLAQYLTVSATSSNPTIVANGNIVLAGTGASRTVTVTPAPNQHGSAIITVTVQDFYGGMASDSFTLTVNPINDAPTITDIAHQTIAYDTATGALPFVVADAETPAGSLTLSGSSSNSTLVPNANIVFGGAGANRTVAVTPAPNQSGSAVITVAVSDGAAGISDTFTITVKAVNDVVGDFDGDGRTDGAVFRRSTGTWTILESSSGSNTSIDFVLGVATDIPAPGDYDGDGRIDPAVFRSSTAMWLVLPSSTNHATTMEIGWGQDGDLPVPGDYDGDHLTDVAVYRPSTGHWYILFSGTGRSTYFDVPWGLSSDIPVPGDYDGDGKTDLAVYRPYTGVWHVLKSGSAYASAAYGLGMSPDVPVPGDYDGDGKTDVAVIGLRPVCGSFFAPTAIS